MGSRLGWTRGGGFDPYLHEHPLAFHAKCKAKYSVAQAHTGVALSSFHAISNSCTRAFKGLKDKSSQGCSLSFPPPLAYPAILSFFDLLKSSFLPRGFNNSLTSRHPHSLTLLHITLILPLLNQCSSLSLNVVSSRRPFLTPQCAEGPSLGHLQVFPIGSIFNNCI